MTSNETTEQEKEPVCQDSTLPTEVWSIIIAKIHQIPDVVSVAWTCSLFTTLCSNKLSEESKSTGVYDYSHVKKDKFQRASAHVLLLEEELKKPKENNTQEHPSKKVSFFRALLGKKSQKHEPQEPLRYFDKVPVSSGSSIDIGLMGDARAGCTQLVKRFTENTFSEVSQSRNGDSSTEDTTIRFSNASLTCTLRHPRLYTFKSVQGYLGKENRCFLVCCDTTSEFSWDRVTDRWLPDILAICTGKPIIVIGLLKTDLKEECKVSIEKVKAYCKLHNMCAIETSAKTGRNVKHVFEYIAEAYLRSIVNKVEEEQ